MLDKNNLHHAYCIEGEKGEVYTKLCVFFEDELGLKIKGNPDFSYSEFDTFSIDEGRSLKERQQNKSLDGGKKIFIISTNFIAREAQNSLLKIFEEPTEGTHFFLIMPSSDILIPTLKSRLQIVSSLSSEKKKGTEDVEIKDFVESSKSQRLLFLKQMIEEKDKQKAIEFLDRLETGLYKGVNFQKVKKEDMAIFDQIIKMKEYLNDRGSSMKIILEHIALVLD